MNPSLFKEEIKRQWAATTVRWPSTSGVHPGGPDGQWVSLHLSGPGVSRVWLHFREGAAGMERAYGDDGWPVDSLRWEAVDVEGSAAAMREFVSSFEEAMSDG